MENMEFYIANDLAIHKSMIDMYITGINFIYLIDKNLLDFIMKDKDIYELGVHFNIERFGKKRMVENLSSGYINYLLNEDKIIYVYLKDIYQDSFIIREIKDMAYALEYYKKGYVYNTKFYEISIDAPIYKAITFDGSEGTINLYRNDKNGIVMKNNTKILTSDCFNSSSIR